MPSTSPVLPVIEISLAPPEEPQPEPYSPFTPLNSGFASSSSSSPDRDRDMDDDDDTYRPTLLTPPVQSWSLSPLRPFNERRPPARPKGQGLKDEEFQALLRASKERSAAAAVAATSKKTDLRKEVALRAHKNKQLERRALFLSKIGAPPSPTAISLPKTPPDSPAIFHYSLPSPGLCSPLALFEKLGLDDQGPEQRGARKVWVEQVDFRLAKQAKAEPGLRPGPVEDDDNDVLPVPVRTRTSTPSITVTTAECCDSGLSGREREEEQPVPSPQPPRGHARKRSVPSLEEITERYSSAQAAAAPASPVPTRPRRAPLPAFLNTRRQSLSPSPPLCNEVPTVMVTSPEPASRPRLACTGRIRFPTRSPSPPSPSLTAKPLPALPVNSEPESIAPLARKRANALPSLLSLPPKSPKLPCIPALQLQVTTTHVPRTESTSPVRLTEANLLALNSRATTAREMLSTIRRRMAAATAATTPPAWTIEDEKQRRRHSAPADLPGAKARRTGFVHPVLLQPGGF